MTDKNVTRKPLTLKRETLRTLTETELRLVAGGQRPTGTGTCTC